MSELGLELADLVDAVMVLGVISAIRQAGHADITEAARWAARSMDRPFTILGMT